MEEARVNFIDGKSNLGELFQVWSSENESNFDIRLTAICDEWFS